MHVSGMGEKRIMFSYLVGNPKLRRENNIKLDLIGILFAGANWNCLVQDRHMTVCCKYGNKPEYYCCVGYYAL